MALGPRIRTPQVISVVVLLAALAACSTGDDDAVATTVPKPDCAHGVGTDVNTQHDGRRVVVHLPACYDQSDVRYPVIYLLHGAGADEQQWIDIGTTNASDRLARAGGIGEALLVLPDQGDMSAAERAASVPDLVAWTDGHYRTAADRDHRAIGGISRGGQAALTAAAQHPEMFGSVGGHSTTLPSDLEELIVGLRPLSGRIELDVGSSDPLKAEVVAFANDLDHSGTSNTLVVADGGHDRSYWRDSIDRYLTFYGASWT